MFNLLCYIQAQESGEAERGLFAVKVYLPACQKTAEVVVGRAPSDKLPNSYKCFVSIHMHIIIEHMLWQRWAMDMLMHIIPYSARRDGRTLLDKLILKLFFQFL